MLSFTEGKAIAKIKGGEHNGKKIRISETAAKEETAPNDPFELIEDDFMRNKKRLKFKQVEKIRRAMKKNKEEIDEELEEMYEEAQKLYDDKLGKEIIVADGQVIPLPGKDTRDMHYVAGPSNSGKSSFAAKYAQQFKKMFPESELFMFSRLKPKKDSAFSKLPISYVPIDESIVEEPIQPEDLGDCLAIFDDIDTIRNKKIAAEIQSLRDDLLETGRHENVYMVCTSHQLMNYKQTRTLLNECTHCTFFPNSGTAYHITRFLKEYGGLPKPEIDKILKLPSRWVTFKKTFPQAIIYQTGCYLLN
jgi:hypothetical protein